MQINICDVCNKEVEKIYVRASAFGAISYAYCDECFEKGLEPYDGMVDYIACAGRFPEDINKEYQTHIRQILAGLGFTEAKFIEDVNTAIKEFEEYPKLGLG